MAELSFVSASRKCREKFVDGGFMYTFDGFNTDKSVKFWRCDRRDFGCKVRLHTDPKTFQIINTLHEHTHDADVQHVELQKLKNDIKKRAIDTSLKPSQVISESIESISTKGIGSLDIFRPSNLKKIIQRHRKRSTRFPQISFPTCEEKLGIASELVVSPNKLINISEMDHSYHETLKDSQSFVKSDPGLTSSQEKEGTTNLQRRRTNRRGVQAISNQRCIKSNGGIDSNTTLDDGTEKQQPPRKNTVIVFGGELSQDPGAESPESEIDIDGLFVDESYNHDKPQWLENFHVKPNAANRRQFCERFIHGGCMYIFDAFSADRKLKFWRCDKRSEDCKVRLHTDAVTGQIVKTINMHTHDVDVREVEVKILKSELKRRAQETNDHPSKVIKESLVGLSPATLAIVQRKNLTKMIERQRNVSLPTHPSSLQDLEIPLRYSTYRPQGKTKDEDFLLHDDGKTWGSNRILIFGRQECLKNIGIGNSNIKHLLLDGSYSLTEPLFQDGQIYVVLTRDEEWIFPIMYVLLPNKTSQTYKRFFTILHQLLPNLNPDVITIDYEVDAIAAVRARFPNAHVTSSFFHLGQCMLRHLQRAHDVHRRYCEDADFALMCKSVVSVAFVPPADIADALTTLEQHLPPDVHFLVEWLEDDYVGRPSGASGGRGDPLFPISMWNIHDSILYNLDTAHHAAESAHRRIQGELGMSQANLWKVIGSIQKVQRAYDAEQEAMRSGKKPPTKKRKRQRDAEQKIASLVRQLSASDSPPTLWHFLQEISLNFQVLP